MVQHEDAGHLTHETVVGHGSGDHIKGDEDGTHNQKNETYVKRMSITAEDFLRNEMPETN